MHQITEMSDKFWRFKKCKKINSSYFEASKNKKVIQQGTYLALENASVMWQRIWCDYDKNPGTGKSFSQAHFFLHQLTHNMTKDCSLHYKFSTWKLKAQNMLCT